MTPGAPRLVLWDLDHTLIIADDFHALLYRDAFRKCFGREPDQLIKMSGRTDLYSMTQTLRLNGIEPTKERRAAFVEALVEAMALRRAHLRQHGRQAKGAAEALARLRDVPGVIQSAATGNLKSLAVAKLETLSLDWYLDFDVGGFGEDHEDRWELVRAARQRAQAKYGVAFDEHNTVLIGDTPYDVRAGHLGGAIIVAVATGSSSATELEAAGAETILPDLGNTDAVIGSILESSSRSGCPAGESARLHSGSPGISSGVSPSVSFGVSETQG